MLLPVPSLDFFSTGAKENGDGMTNHAQCTDMVTIVESVINSILEGLFYHSSTYMSQVATCDRRVVTETKM